MTIEKQIKRLGEYNAELTPGNVKAAAKAAEAGSSDLYKVPVSALRVLPDFNLRIHSPEYTSKVQELARSILANGFYNTKPLAVFVAAEDGKNVFYVQDGHRRLEATQIAITAGAPITDLPVVVMPRSMNAEQQLVHMLRSNEGEPFKMYEKAIAAARLVNFGKDEKQIAEVLGCTVQAVKDLLTLAGAPAEIRKMVESGEISGTFAVETIKKSKDKAVAVVREAKKTAKAAGKRTTAKQAAKKDEDLSLKKQKKHGPEAFDLLVKIMNKHGKVIDNEFHVASDALFLTCGVI